MSNHTYSISEIVGTSTQGVDDAVRNGIAKASQTLRNLDWFEVKEVRGHLEDGKIADWQVTIKIGFRLEDHGLNGFKRRRGREAFASRPLRA